MTWISNDQTQIDHLAIGPRWRVPCLQDGEVDRGADICSDHHLVIVKIKIRLKRQKKVNKIPKCFDTSKLKNPATRLRFQAMLQNRFSALYRIPSRNGGTKGRTE